MPDLNATELRTKLGRKPVKGVGFQWIKRENHGRASRRNPSPRNPRQSASCRKTSASIPTGTLRGMFWDFADIDNVGIAGIEKYIDTQGLQFRPGDRPGQVALRTQARPVVARSARAASAARRADEGHREIPRHCRSRRRTRCQHRRDDRHSLTPGFRPEQPRSTRMTRTASTG